MTALSVWWRRNFGHRNDPVTWTRPIEPHEPVGKTIEREEAQGWQMVPGSLVLRRKGPGSVQFIRFDKPQPEADPDDAYADLQDQWENR